jgi:threonine aldolase
MSRPLPGIAGRITPEQVRTIAAGADIGQPPGIVVLENTHRSAGGRVWPLDEFRAVVDTARDLGLAVHLDGARIFNAAVAAGIPAAEYGRLADSVTVCFSKGLGCPLGAILASSRERIETAWRGKFLFGGALRQAGIVAAAMLYALDHHVDRLAEDHARARLLAEGLAENGAPVDVDAVETNFIGVDVASIEMEVEEARERIKEHGVLVGLLSPGVLRVATYLGVTDEDIEMAADAIPRALATAPLAGARSARTAP